MAFSNWRFKHVVHLAKEIDKKDGFVVEVLQPMHLFLVEIVHLMGSDDLVIIEVDY